MPRNAAKIRAKYEASFLKELEGLNLAQRQAVESIEGPVLVVAGPGTGKTHILGARIGQILRETDTQPFNILCLTYTDSGVHAMRERLLKFIGPEAHRVHINTFHSFCNNIVQDNLHLFGLRELEPITDLERLELVGELLDKLDKDHPLKNLKNERRIYDKKLIDLFGRMKSEGWTAEFIGEKIDSYLADLPKREEFIYKRKQGKYQKGDLKEGQFQKEVQKMRRLRAGTLLFTHYQRMMRQLKRYDFADMLLWVNQAFEENEEVLRSYQEQYLYFLVDEFQDTNGTQNKLLQLLIGYWDKPNVFVVGDDDQSIFEFQGARVKNLIDFFQTYAGDQKPIVLSENYRSSQFLLDSAKAVIDHNELRLINQVEGEELHKDLKAAHPVFSKGEMLPRLVAYPNAMHEITDIVLQIEELRQQEIHLSEIAVIYAKHKQGRNLINLLSKKGIPYQTKKRINILEQPMIRKILTMFEYLQAEFERPESGEELLYEILHYDFVKIDPSDITRLAVFKAKRPDAPPWREIINDAGITKALGLVFPDRLYDIHDFFIKIKADYVNLPLLQLLERLVNRSGLMRELAKKEDKVWELQILTTFFNFVQEETDRHPQFQVPQLLDIINRMKENGLELGLSKTIYSKDGGVNLISGHSSKGLEFRYVFLLDCGDEWEPRTRASQRRFAFPDTLTLSGPEDGMEAARRLFYVAMTRSKEFLQVSYSQFDKKDKPKRHARFIDELAACPTVKKEERFVPPYELADAQFFMLTEAQQPEVTLKLTKEEIDDLLAGFALSPTSLGRYMTCPLSFYYENVLRLPSTSSEAAAYGTAIHNSLDWAFGKMKADENKAFPPTEKFVNKFRREMNYQRAFLSKRQFQRRMELGELRLPEYYALRVPTWHKKVELERNFRNVEWNGIPLSGTVDKIEFIDKRRLHIVDYKTGSPKLKQTSRPHSKNKKGGDYWRQVIFYKILLENYRNYDWEVVSGEVDYLEKDKLTDTFPQVRIEITPEDVETVQEQIQAAYDGIQAHDFYEGCGKKECKWCQFTLNYAMVDSFRDELAEEMDD